MTATAAPVTNLRASRKEQQAAATPAAAPKPAKVNVRQVLDDAIVRASWEMPLDRIRELAGLPELTDDLIVARLDHHLKYHSGRLYSNGQRK